MDAATLRQLLGNASPYLARVLVIGALLWLPVATVFWWSGRTAVEGRLQHRDEFTFAAVPTDLEPLRAWVAQQPGIQDARLEPAGKDGEEAGEAQVLELRYASTSKEALAPPWSQLGYPRPQSTKRRWTGRFQISVHQEPGFYLFLLARCLDLAALIVAIRWFRRARRSGRPLPRLFEGAAGPAASRGLGTGMVLGGLALLYWWLVPLSDGGIAGAWPLTVFWPGWVRILALSLVPLVFPLCQELFFRGALLGSFQGGGCPKTGILVSALLFTVAQLNLREAPVFLVMGIAQAWLYNRTRSLLAPLVAGFVCAALAITLPSFVVGPGLLQDLLKDALDALKHPGK